MSDRIDQRIVEMSFENHKFEKGINQSKNSLKEFSNALDRMGSGKDFSGLENSVQSISRQFSALEQIGVGALRRIGESAVNAGATLIKSLTVDQLSAGLSKYQQKIEAVQTMVSAGYGLEEVEKSMAQLMWFSDETSYSFADMAGNMGKFVAAGIDLETSQKAMQGIATWAAHSGKNSTAASIAMFNLSQAISLGYVDTLNWRSIMNQNMNTKMFKQIAIGVGEATGAIEKGQVSIQNFDSNLKDKWFTNDVLLKTLGQYSAYSEKVKEIQEEMNFDTAQQAMDYMDANPAQYADVLDQIGNAAFKAAQESKSFMDSINATMDAVSTGWMRTYEIIFGTLDEAKANFSGLTEVLWAVFASSAEGRNEMLQLVKDGGGIKQLFQVLKNVAVALLTPLKAISQAFDQFFPPKTTKQWLNIITILETVSKKLIVTEETADKIRRTFAGFFAVVDLGWQVVKFLGSALYEIVNVFVPLGGGLLDTTASIGDFLVVMNQVIKQSGVFQYGLLGIKIAAVILNNILTSVISKVSAFVRGLWNADKPLEFLGLTARHVFSGVLDVLQSITTWITSKFTKAVTGMSNFFNEKFNVDNMGVLGTVLSVLKEFITFIGGEASDSLKNFGSALIELDFSKIATFVTGGILLLFINQLSNLTRGMANFIAATTTFITNFSKKLFGTTTKIKDLAYVVGILSASLYVLSKIPWEDMKVGLKGMAGALALFVVAYGSIQAITVVSSKALKGIDVVKSTFNLATLALAAATMAVALGTISKIDQTKVWESVKVLGAMMGLLVVYQALSAFISTIPGQTAVSVRFGGMVLGVMGLVGIVAVLSAIPIDAIKKGLGKLAGILVVITGIQTLFAFVSRIGKGHKLSLNLLGIAGGLLGLLAVMKLLSSVSTREITSGIKNVLLMGGVLAAIQLMFNLAGRVGGGVKFKTNVFTMQMGILSMIAVIAILGTMDQQNIQNGIKSIAKMAGIIAALEVFTAIAAKIGGGNKLQRILGSVALTMVAFTALIGLIGVYKQETIDRGLLTITKMLTIILAFETLSALAGRLGGGVASMAGVIGMATALLTVTTSLILLSMIDQKALRKATISLGIAVIAVGTMVTGFGIMTRAMSMLAVSVGGVRTLLAKIVPGLAALGVVILSTIALMGIIKFVAPMVESVKWSTLGTFAIGLGLISGLVTAFTLLSKIPGLKGGMGGISTLIPGFAGATAAILATAGLFILLGTILPKINNIDWSGLDKFIMGLGLVSAMVIGMALLAPVFAMVGAVAGPALGGILVAIAGVALVIGAFVGLSALMEALFSGNSDFLMQGIEKLIIVGEGIGRFLGAIAGGFSTEVMIGYGKGLAGFAYAVKGIDAKSFDGVESLARALLILTGTAMIDGLSRFVNLGKNPGEVFGEQLSSLIKAFNKISPDAASNASEVIASLAPMAENLTLLAESAKSIPNSGGFIGDFLGNNDVDTFGEMLKSFVANMSPITVGGAKHAGLVMASLAPMASNLKSFARAADNIPNTGGFMQGFLGGNDVDDFGRMLVQFVGIFKTLDPVADVGRAKVALVAMVPMIDSLKKFADLANDLPNSGGMVTWFTGDNDVKTFVTKIASFVVELGGLDTGQVEKANSTIRSMNSEMMPGLERLANLSNNLISGGGLESITGQSSLVTLAKNLKSFVKELKGVDVSIVGPALQSLTDVTDSFKVIGSGAITSALESFQNNKRPFQAGIALLLDEIVSLVTSKQKSLELAFTGIISNALTKSRTYIGKFKILGEDLINGLKSGIDAKTSVATEAIVGMSRSVIGQATSTFDINSPSKVFASIGGWLGLGLANGIQRNSKVATLASINMAEGVENGIRDTLGIHSLSDTGISIGEWWGKSVGKGVTDITGFVTEKAEELGIGLGDFSVKGITESIVGGEGAVTSGINSLLEILTGSKSLTDVLASLGIDTGDTVLDGMVSGITDPAAAGKISGAVRSVAEDAYTIFKRYIDDRKEYHLISLEEELAEWENFSKKYASGTRTRIKADDEVARVKMELDTKSFNHSKTWIDKEKYYKRLTLLDELAAWERVQARYAQGHAYRMEAERELFRLKEELQQAEFQNAAEWIDEEKYYGRLNVVGELKAWQLIRDNYEEYSDERKKADREVFRLEEDIRKATEENEKQIQDIKDARDEKREQAAEDYYNKEKEITSKLINDVNSLKDAYDAAVKARTQSLYSTWGLFDEVNISDTNGQDLLGNLEDQVVAFDQWQAQITELAKKGISDGLINELTEMGPQSLSQIVALNKLSAPELDKYVTLWGRKSGEAKDQAIYELAEMNTETLKEIDRLTLAADAELDYYEQVWKDSTKAINDDAELKLGELETIWDKSMTDMTNGGLTIIQGFKTSLAREIGEMVVDTRTQMTELASITSNMQSMSSAAAAAAIATEASNTRVNAALTSMSTSSKTSGKEIPNGLSSGIEENRKTAENSMTSLAKTSLGAFNSYFMIQSPSRKTIETGMYFVQGFVEGLKRFGGSVQTAGASLGQSALDALGMSMTSVPDLLTDTGDAFSIKPVLDLTNVRSGMENIKSLFSGASGLDLGANIDLLPSNANNQNGILTDIKNGLQSLTNPEVDLTGILTIQVVNDKGEIVQMVDTTVKDILRRESR